MGIAIEKMDAEVLFEVEAVGQDLGKIRGSIFSIKIPKKILKLHEGKFLNTEIGISVKESAFSQRWLLFDEF